MQYINTITITKITNKSYVDLKETEMQITGTKQSKLYNQCYKIKLANHDLFS